MRTFIIGAILGLLVGGVSVFYFFVGVPRSNVPPGAPIRSPDATVSAGSAQIVLRQDFFNEILTTIFRDMNDPAFAIGSGPSPECDGRLTIVQQGSDATTSLRFENNRIAAPLAFSGNYNSPIGCFPFAGWAQAYLDLRYDAATQTVFGNINIETVNLDGVNPIISGLVTPLVQTTLNNQVNPVQILRGEQIGVNAPLASTGGTLRANVEDVRAEIKENALNLYVIYAFSGGPTQP